MVRRLLLLSALVSAELISAPVKHTQYHWSLGPTLPEAVQEIYPTVHDEAIYVAGGLREDPASTGLKISDNVWRLTSPGEKWEAITALPEGRHHPMLASAGGRLWLFGGFVASEEGQWTNTDTVLFYDEKAGAWTPHNPMPVKLSESVSAVINGHIHLTGGRQPLAHRNGRWSDSTDSNWHGIFEPNSGVWLTEPPLPVARNSACSVVIGDNWHVIGGRTVEGGNTTLHDVYDNSKREWKQAEPLPHPLAGMTCNFFKGDIYVFGGEYFTDGGGVDYKVWRYELDKNRWQDVSVMPIPRHGLGSVVHKNAIWLIGGAKQAGAHETSKTVSKFMLAEDVGAGEPAREN